MKIPFARFQRVDCVSRPKERIAVCLTICLLLFAALFVFVSTSHCTLSSCGLRDCSPDLPAALSLAPPLTALSHLPVVLLGQCRRPGRTFVCPRRGPDSWVCPLFPPPALPRGEPCCPAIRSQSFRVGGPWPPQPAMPLLSHLSWSLPWSLRMQSSLSWATGVRAPTGQGQCLTGIPILPAVPRLLKE